MSDHGLLPGDADVRRALRSTLLPKGANEADTAIFEELGVCRGRARLDMAVVNGMLHGYEIKSNRDNLRRLSVQADFYGKVCDRATLVVGGRHLTEALDLLPAWWGVLRFHSAAGDLRFKVVRRARANPGRDLRSLVEFLWSEDAIALLESHHVARGVRGRPRWLVWERVCERLSGDIVAAAVRHQLKARAATQARP